MHYFKNIVCINLVLRQYQKEIDFSARTGTRTPTPITVLDPKSSASANSAILANVLFPKGVITYKYFSAIIGYSNNLLSE